MKSRSDFYARLVLISALAIAATQVVSQVSKSTHTPKASRPADAALANKSPDELAQYVFDHKGCNTCHTLGSGGKLGFTPKGKETGKDFEGCVSLLTSMNVIAQTRPADRTSEEKEKAARFHEFGCTECHQIVPGKMGLTATGAQLKSLHMACTDVERVLASKKGQ